MRVYPVQRRMRLDSRDDGVDEIIGVYTSLEAAQKFVHDRIGKTLTWTEHNGHGAVWAATDSWWSAGKICQVTNEYGITEHELEENRDTGLMLNYDDEEEWED